MFPTRNQLRLRRHMEKLVGRLSRKLYKTVERRSHQLNLYTHEFRSGSKAERVILGSESIFASDSV